MRSFHNSEIHLNENELGLYTFQGYPFLTNARPGYVQTQVCYYEEEINIALVNGQFRALSDKGQEALRPCGFESFITGARTAHSAEGKFVFMKNGTFFLSHRKITHMDLPPLIGLRDPVAVMSGGFVTITEAGVDLHGESVSLGKGPYFGTPYDRQAIAAHLSVPFLLTEDEFID
jgi:hypothetical protein